MQFTDAGAPSTSGREHQSKWASESSPVNYHIERSKLIAAYQKGPLIQLRGAPTLHSMCLGTETSSWLKCPFLQTLEQHAADDCQLFPLCIFVACICFKRHEGFELCTGCLASYLEDFLDCGEDAASCLDLTERLALMAFARRKASKHSPKRKDSELPFCEEVRHH